MPNNIKKLSKTDKENLPEPDTDGLFTVDARIEVSDDEMMVVEVMGKKMMEKGKFELSEEDDFEKIIS